MSMNEILPLHCKEMNQTLLLTDGLCRGVSIMDETRQTKTR